MASTLTSVGKCFETTNFLELRKAEVRLPRIPFPRTPVNKGRSPSGNIRYVQGWRQGEVYEGTVFACKDPRYLGPRGCPHGHPGLGRSSASGTRFRVRSSRIRCHEDSATHAGV